MSKIPKSLISFIWDVIRVILIGKVEKEIDRADKKVKEKINQSEDLDYVEPTSESERTDLERIGSGDTNGDTENAGSKSVKSVEGESAESR